MVRLQREVRGEAVVLHRIGDGWVMCASYVILLKSASLEDPDGLKKENIYIHIAIALRETARKE